VLAVTPAAGTNIAPVSAASNTVYTSGTFSFSVVINIKLYTISLYLFIKYLKRILSPE
jgi:hypothetical protein